MGVSKVVSFLRLSFALCSLVTFHSYALEGDERQIESSQESTSAEPVLRRSGALGMSGVVALGSPVGWLGVLGTYRLSENKQVELGAGYSPFTGSNYTANLRYFTSPESIGSLVFYGGYTYSVENRKKQTRAIYGNIGENEKNSSSDDDDWDLALVETEGTVSRPYHEPGKYAGHWINSGIGLNLAGSTGFYYEASIGISIGLYDGIKLNNETYVVDGKVYRKQGARGLAFALSVVPIRIGLDF